MNNLIILLSSLLLVACGILEFLFPVSYPQRYTHREITDDALVGNWIITPDSETRIKDFVQQQQEPWALTAPWKAIELDSTGTCTVEAVPSWLPENTVLSKQEALSTCTWKTDSILGYDEVGSFKQVPGIHMRFEHYSESENNYEVFYADLYIAEENDQLLLWDFIGDPTNLYFQDFKPADQ